MLRMKRNDIRQVAAKLVQPDTIHQHLQCGKGAGTGFSHIQMRIGSENCQRISIGHHLRRDIGMHVQTCDKRHIRPDLLTDKGQQLSLAILQPIGDHGTVQVEIDPVYRAGITNAVQNFGAYGLIRIICHLGGRFGRTPQDRVKFNAAILCGSPRKSRNGKGAAFGSRQNGRTAKKSRKGIGNLKGCHVGGRRPEYICFMLKPGNSNSRHINSRSHYSGRSCGWVLSSFSPAAIGSIDMLTGTSCGTSPDDAPLDIGHARAGR